MNCVAACFALASAFVLTACGTAAHREAMPVVADVQLTPPIYEFHGPNTGFGVQHLQDETYAGQSNVWSFAPAIAVDCNDDRTQCRHAAVGLVLRFDLHEVDGEGVRGSAILESSIGRSVAAKNIVPGHNSSYVRSIDDSVEVIDERNDVQSVLIDVRYGERLMIDGPAGSAVSILFQPGEIRPM